MNKIDQQIHKIKSENRLGLMTHVIVGYPSLEETVELAKIMEKSGADFIELQIPFSDPLADGPTIMQACEFALENGVKVQDAFRVANDLSLQVQVPLLFMAYFNTVFKYGTKKFCRDVSSSGIAGLIVPDMPIEEESREHFNQYCLEYGLHNIRVISPASTKDRLQKNARLAKGFLYCTARQGTTGAQEGIDPKVVNYLKQVRKEFTVPIAVGFGISKREHVAIIKPLADIVVVGSPVIDIINRSGKFYQKEVEYFLQHLMKG